MSESAGKQKNDKVKRTPGKMISALWPFLPALCTFAIVRLSVHHGVAVEYYYSGGVYPVIATVLSGISRYAPFSMWDLSWVIVIVLLISGLLLVITRTIRPGWFLLRTCQVAALLYTLFYLSWGLNYFRPGMVSRLGWEKTKTDEVQFRAVLDTLTIQANKYYAGVRMADYKEIDSLIEKSYALNAKRLGLDYPNGYRKTKTMMFSYLLIKFGISGYFGPFFNEVNLNRFIQPRDYPFTLAHEKAHQFGIASEAEANLAAFVVCYNSDDRRLKYSACRNLLLYFLGDASSLKDYDTIKARLDPRVLHDLQSRQRFYLGLRNRTMEKVQTFIYNIFLRSNHVPGGVMNYNQVVGLVIRWFNSRPGQ